jgi:hypothetical protein
MTGVRDGSEMGGGNDGYWTEILNIEAIKKVVEISSK